MEIEKTTPLTEAERDRGEANVLKMFEAYAAGGREALDRAMDGVIGGESPSGKKASSPDTSVATPRP